MKFKNGVWHDMKVMPVHEGHYDVHLQSGDKIRAEFRAGAWIGGSVDFSQWRGMELKGMAKTRIHRENMDKYRAATPGTHGQALEGALFLARRAVSLNFQKDAYRYYLIANAIDRTRLAEVDKKCMERFASKGIFLGEQSKADKFFDRWGGRPQVS